MTWLDDYKAELKDLDDEAYYKKWRNDNPLARDEFDAYRASVLAGTPITPGAHLVATAYGRRLVDEGMAAIHAKLLEEKLLPPPAAAILFGHHHAIQEHNYTREAQEMAANGGQIVRTDYYPGGPQDSVIAAVKAAGNARLSLIIGGTKTTPPTDLAAFGQLAVQAATANPTAFIEGPNEPPTANWTPKNVVDANNALTSALRAANLPHVRVMSAMSGSERQSYGSLGPRQFCRELVASGFRVGVTADVANFHLYQSIGIESSWMHYVTPGSDGSSCLSILGLSRFALTEFGCGLGDVAGNQQAQADRITAFVSTLKKTTGFVYGCVYAMSDQAGGDTTGYGLCDTNWVRRLAWSAYKAAIA